MTPEETYFLNCLSSCCTGAQTDPPPERLDLEELFRIAEEQSLGGIVFDQMQKWLGYRIGGGGFQKEVIRDAYYSVNREMLLKEIAGAFGRAGISFLCMKGALLREYYPVPELREMGDLDLVIHPEDRQKSDRIMTEELGYRRFVDNHAVWTYYLNTFEVEIHDHMFYEHLANRFDYRSYFDHVWEHVQRAPVFGIQALNLLVPEEEFHFLYLMAHTAKHVINNGSGFRAYLDMILLSRRIASEMWDRIVQELEMMELLDFTMTCSALCEQWFGVGLPVSHAALDSVFLEEVTRKTFHDGIFGLENRENEGANAAKEIKRADRKYWRTAARLTLMKLFPPYEDMQLIPWYSFVDGRPYLLPAAWIYRWFYCLFHKFPQAIRMLAEPFVRKGKIEEREDLIRSWGL